MGFSKDGEERSILNFIIQLILFYFFFFKLWKRLDGTMDDNKRMYRLFRQSGDDAMVEIGCIGLFIGNLYELKNCQIHISLLFIKNRS